MAATALFVLVLCKDKVVLISSMDAAIFIVFAMPTAVSAQTKHVIGSHLIGLVCGAIFYFTNLLYFLEYSLVVGIAVFLMVALDVIINEVSLNAFITIMIRVVVLSQCRYYLRRY